MKETYRERPQQPISTWDEIQWAEPKQWQDEITGSILFCWPLASEAQMWVQARCCECRRRPAQWIGLGSPFGDGEQYFLESAAWCFWCLPREHFTDEELRLVRNASGLGSRRWMKSSNSSAMFADGPTTKLSTRLFPT